MMTQAGLDHMHALEAKHHKALHEHAVVVVLCVYVVALCVEWRDCGVSVRA